MAKNTTGLAQPGDYILGRGTVYVSTLASSVPDGKGWRDLGNSPEFTLSIETEKLEHKSSRAGLQVVDKEVILSQKMSIAFSIDEFNDENLALWSQGATAVHTNPAIAGFVEHELVASGDLVLGRWYDLADSSGNRCYDVEDADLTLTTDDGAATLAITTDYLLDAKMGRIFILSGATNISAGEDLDYAQAADAGASPVEEVRGLTGGQVLVAVKFIAENPASSNKQREYQFHSVTLASEGDVALIGDEFATMGFSGAVESNTIADINAPFVRVRDHALS